MPIYEYQCSACEHQLEAIQKFSDALLTQCPVCNTASLVKKISAAGFRLTGSGWYETDFKSGNKKNLTAGDVDKSTSEKSTADKPAATAAPAAPASTTTASTAATAAPAKAAKD